MREEIPPPTGTMRSMVEGFFQTSKNPSTALRAVPLPAQSRGGILIGTLRLTPLEPSA
jgi:hypothetical protein